MSGTAATLHAREGWQWKFLAEMRKTGNVTHSAAAAGVERSTVYRERDADPDFAEQWGDAVEQAADNLEMEARRRAVEGVEKPIFYKGERCDGGEVREYSDRLLELLLKGNRPAKYKDSQPVGESDDTEKAARAIRTFVNAAGESVPEAENPTA